MDYDIAIKLGVLCVGMVAAAKGLFDLSIGMKGKLRDEYKFAKYFLADVETFGKMHPYLKEKGYQAIAGDERVTAKEVEYLLSLINPEQAIKDYVMGRDYLEHLSVLEDFQIVFKEKYKTKWSRMWRMFLYFGCYMICVLGATAPWIFSSLLHLNMNQFIFYFLLSAVIFGPYAWWFFRSGQKIANASRLVRRQYHRSERFLVVPSSNNKSKEF